MHAPASRTITLELEETANCCAWGPHTFTLQSPIWRGPFLRLTLPYNLDGVRPQETVIGLEGLNAEAYHEVQVAHAIAPVSTAAKLVTTSGGRKPANGQSGWLIWGGSAGIRVLGSTGELRSSVDRHLPAGLGGGYPIY